MQTPTSGELISFHYLNGNLNTLKISEEFGYFSGSKIPNSSGILPF